RRDRDPGAPLARAGDADGARVRRGVHARRRPAALPRRRRPARQPRGGRGAPGPGHGHVVREPGARDRVRRPARRRARAEGLPGAVRDRQGDRPPEARDDGRRDRRAHRRAGQVPRVVGRGHLTETDISWCQTPFGGRDALVTDLSPEAIVRLDVSDPPAVVVLDQRRLPDEAVDLRCETVPELAAAIRTLAVRGAPAIGVAAAYGIALAALRGDDLAV